MVTVTPLDGGFIVGLRVSPGAKTTRCAGEYGDRLKVRVAAPPEHNRANDELLSAMAEWLEVPKETLSLWKGRTSRDKTVRCEGLTRGEFEKRLARLVRAH